MKLFKKIWPILAVLCIFAFFFVKGKINDKNFYKEKLNAKIIDRKNWAEQTAYFYLENKVFIDSNDVYNFDLKIGDSISKLSNTWKFKVYRKNDNGMYEFRNNYCKSPQKLDSK